MKKILFIIFLFINQILVAEEFSIRKHPFLTEDDFECAALFNNILFIGGDDEHVYQSFDFGKTWTSQKLRGVNGDVEVLYQVNNGTILAGINEWDAHYIAISTDRGTSWDRVYKDNTIEIHCMFERKDGTIIAFGDDDVYLSSSADYTYWDEIKRPWRKTLPEFEEIDITAVNGLSGNKILLVGENGFYACYDQEMKKCYFGCKLENTNRNFTALVPAFNTVFFAGTEEGNLLKSTDSGKTWNLDYKDTLHKDEITKICFNASGVGIAVGFKGLMLVTENWGGAWKRIDSQTIEHMHDVITLNENTFFAVGDNGLRMSIIAK